MQQYIIRSQNILTGKDRLETLIKIDNFPTSMSCVPANYDDEKFLNMEIQICQDTGLVQMKNFPKLDDMYVTPHNSSYGKVWENMFDILSGKIINIINDYKYKKILEIGGGSLLLASKILKSKDISKYVVYEKNSLKYHSDDNRIILHKCYFTEETEINEDIDIVIHSHVLEHTITPKEFINSIKKIKPKYHIFAVPNLHKQFEKKFTNSFNFEHNILLTEPYIDILLHNNNFEIIEKEYYLDHSIIYITKYIDDIISPKNFPNMYDEYKDLVIDFFAYHNKIIKDINTKISEFKGTVFLFGGHIFSQFLIKLGLNTDKIINILDNSKEKEDMKLYGTKLIIKNPSVIQNIINVAIILKAGSYQNEIKQQLKEINKNVIIFE